MHELVLGHSSEWVLKGEGNANAVFGYAGTDSALIGRVIRVRKQPAEAVTDHISDKLTKDLWGREFCSALTFTVKLTLTQGVSRTAGPDAEQLSDVSQYFVPALGSKYVTTGVQIQLSSDFVAELNRQLKDNQQLHNPVTLLTLNGSILPDATVFLQTAIADAATAKVSASQPLSTHSCALQHESSLQISSQPPSQQSTTQQGINNKDKHAQSQHDEALDLEGQPHTNWQASNVQMQKSQAAYQLLPALCVEIKPKWGLLPSSPAIAAKHAIKKQVSRFQLQQHLKLAQGKVSSISAYDPLDLFSGEAIRMHKALVALIANPQNSLKFFVDGKPVDTVGLAAQPESIKTLSEKSFGLDSDSIKPGDAVALFADVLTDILLSEGVLQKLLSIQALDAHDIEGIYPLYRHVLQQLRLQTDSPNEVHSLSPFEGISSESELSALQPQEAHVRSLLRKTWSEQISMIRDYLLATTAKDCSLMITMQTLPAALLDHMDSQCHCNQSSEFQEGFDLVAVPKIAVVIKYKVAVVDLDVKPHAKILSHYCLDQEIMKQQAIL